MTGKNTRLLHQVKNATVLFLAGGTVFAMVDIVLSESVTFQEGLLIFFNNGLFCLMVWYGNELIAEKVPISWVDHPIRRFLVSLILTVAYTYLITVFYQVIYSLFCCGKMPWEVIPPIDTAFFRTVLIITLLISTFMHGRAFLIQYKMSLLESERLKQTALASRFESLKNQVNPHFLFNSFNVLSSLVYKDQDLAARFIKQLSIVYRYVLDTKDQEVVTLTTELEVLEAYIFLIQMRFGEKLQIQLGIRKG